MISQGGDRDRQIHDNIYGTTYSKKNRYKTKEIKF